MPNNCHSCYNKTKTTLPKGLSKGAKKTKAVKHPTKKNGKYYVKKRK